MLLEVVFRSVDAPLCLLSDVGIVLSANDMWLESMQLTARTAIGRTLHMVASERAALISDASAHDTTEPIRLPPRPRRNGGVWEETLRRIETGGRVVFLLSARAHDESATEPRSGSQPPTAPPPEKAPEPDPDAPTRREEVYRATFENNRDALALLEAVRSPSGEVLDWICFDANETAAALLGRARSEAIGKRLSELNPERSASLSVGYQRVLATGERWRYETRVGTADYLLEVFRIDADRVGSAAVDVQSIRAVETALRRSEKHIRQLIEHVPTGVALLDREMRYLAVSRRWASDYGLDYDSLVGRSHYEVFPEIPERWREIHRRCLSGAIERCAEDPFVRANGRLDWVEWEIQPWRNPDGTVGGLILFAVMITERKQAADILLAAKERLAVTLSSIGDAVMATDELGRITVLNRVAERLTGWSSAEALNRPLHEVYRIVSEATGERLPSPAERALLDGEIVQLSNHTDLVARNGERRPIADSAAPIRDTQGRIVGVVLVFRDQTAVRAAEMELKRSRAELSNLIERLQIGVFVCQGDEIVYANPAFAEYCERAVSDLIGRHLAELAAHGEKVLPEDGEEWEVLTPNGRSVTLSCSPVRTIEFDGRPAHLWTCRDLSPIKAMQAQLIHKDRLATVGLLAAGVAHEINNPLAYLLVALEVIDEKLHRLAAVVPEGQLTGTFELLHDACVGADRVKAIVSDLKTFSRGDRDERVTLDLKRSLDSAIAIATNEIKPRARLVCRFDAAPRVIGNEARLGQVFLNLLVNAAHAIPEGDPERNEICVVLRTDVHGRAVVEVLDSGLGLSREVLDRVFIPFFTTKAGMGTGLGLAISRNTVNALGGEITLENRPEGGAIARVVLPPGDVDFDQVGGMIGGDESKTYRARVLVVDDEAAICSTFERLLEGEHEVATETSAREAWHRFANGERFDVIFCDVMMPGMSGMELHRRLQREVPDQADRIVFMTGGTFTRSATEYLENAPNPRLDKPCGARDIRQLVARVLRDQQSKVWRPATSA